MKPKGLYEYFLNVTALQVVYLLTDETVFDTMIHELDVDDDKISIHNTYQDIHNFEIMTQLDNLFTWTLLQCYIICTNLQLQI